MITEYYNETVKPNGIEYLYAWLDIHPYVRAVVADRFYESMGEQKCSHLFFGRLIANGIISGG